jgi:hypothetical protein
MLALFPLHFLSPLAYLILRVVAGVVFFQLGSKLVELRGAQNTPKLFMILGIFEMLTGIFFFLGAYLQIAAIIALIVAAVQIFRNDLFAYPGYPPRVCFILLFFISLSLFITGAGFFAFDLPL